MKFIAAGQALKDMTFHQAYSSDLQRAHKTCQIILEENQKSPITSANIIQDKLLQERDHGNFEGMKWIDFKPLMDKNFEFKSNSGFVSIKGYKPSIFETLNRAKMSLTTSGYPVISPNWTLCCPGHQSSSL